MSRPDKLLYFYYDVTSMDVNMSVHMPNAIENDRV